MVIRVAPENGTFTYSTVLLLLTPSPHLPSVPLDLTFTLSVQTTLRQPPHNAPAAVDHTPPQQQTSGVPATTSQMMELQRQVYHPPAAKIPRLHPQNSLSIKDHLREVFKELLPLASQWQIIGTLLNVPPEKLDCIKQDYSRGLDSLREMVTAWLKRIDPPPTWEQLVEAVEPLDQARAEAIRSKHCQL